MPDSVAAPRLRFREWITHRYFVRVPMAMMLSLVVLSGTIASRVLGAFGVRWIAVGYLLAVTFSCLVFFLLVRVWLASAVRVRRRATAFGHGSDDGTVDGSFWFSGGSGSGSSE